MRTNFQTKCRTFGIIPKSMIIIHVTLKRFNSPCSFGEESTAENCSIVGDGILVESDGALSLK